MSDQHSLDSTAPSSRRDFVSGLTLSGLAVVAGACAGSAPPTTTPTPSASIAPPSQAAATPAPPPPPPAAQEPPIQLPHPKDDGPWDMSWLDRVERAKYKLVFDIGAYLDGGGLYYAKNYLNGMRDGWGVESNDVIALLGVSGNGYPLVFGDAIWEKYKYGVSSKTNDPRTGQPAIRNVFWKPKASEPMGEFGVDLLQARGAQMLFCNNVFRGVIRRTMRETRRPYAEVRKELRDGMLPGVIVVPAMVAAMAMAQAKGAGYVFAGV